MTGLTNVKSAAEEEEARRSIRGGARLGDGERSAAEEEEARRSIRGGARLGDGERLMSGVCVLPCLANANRVGG